MCRTMFLNNHLFSRSPACGILKNKRLLHYFTFYILQPNYINTRMLLEILDTMFCLTRAAF